MGKNQTRLFLYCLVVAAVAALWPVTVLEVSLPKAGNKTISLRRVHVGDKVRVSYRHSVELIQVEGFFSISPSGLTAIETRYESSGSGLPNNALRKTMRSKGWYIVDEEERPIDQFRFYIVPINHTRISVAEKPLAINKLEGGTLIQLESKKTIQIMWLLKLLQILL